MPADDLAARLLAGERAAVSDALNLVDDSRPDQQADARELLNQLDGRGDRALRVGITGAPGSGKSTLIDALVREIRSQDQSVGIIAVDPSSRSTGGALLGDRMRMRSSATDTGVFMRSMAARDRLGGLADATRAGAEILSVVFDWVFIETVGVGQSESEVSHLVDTLVFVAHPSAGDTLQFMKAGILELPDLFIVNKADIGPRALRTANELQAGLGLGTAREDGWLAPVLLTSARGRRWCSRIGCAHAGPSRTSGYHRSAGGAQETGAHGLRDGSSGAQLRRLRGEGRGRPRGTGATYSRFGFTCRNSARSPRPGNREAAARAARLKILRLLLWGLIASALLGLAIGTLIRIKLEAPTRYIGLLSGESALATVPFHVADLSPPVLDTRHHEEQVG